MAKGPARGTFKSSIVKSLIGRIEKVIEQRESAIDNCRTRYKQSLNALYAEAEVKNIPVKSLKAYILGRAALRGLRNALEHLPPENQIEVTLLAEAMGDDLPLFKFAQEKEAAADLDALMTAH